MNVFEDLIDELKEENLLENTGSNGKGEEQARPAITTPVRETLEVAGLESAANSSHPIAAAPVEIEIIQVADEPAPARPAAKPKKAKSASEYFKKRAVDEVSSLQMVEHVLTGVEREYMKVIPKGFDDFNAKKALNSLLNAADDSNSEEYKVADLAFRQETQAWGLALLERDRNISVANLRHYCENTKPALSSQAVVALGRFYRNAPYSENVRSKFDFVITRLFSRPIEHEKRGCLFDRDDMLNHIRTLYKEWASVPLYDADDDESSVLLTGLSFDDLAVEAENAARFDQLIESDFFGRVRLFKESISELFFAPTVIVSAIESNVRIGNAYVNLIVRERRKMDAASVQLKYAEFNDPSVSDAAGRTLDLAELLNGLTDDVLKEDEQGPETSETNAESLNRSNKAAAKSEAKGTKGRSPMAAMLVTGALGINKWLLVFGFAALVLCASLYVWSEYLIDDKVSVASAENVSLDGTILSEHIKTGRKSGDRFYGMLLPTWDGLSKDKREDYLQKVYQLESQKGIRQVSLIGKGGRTLGYADPTRLDVYMP
jgi:hypothetical protein